MKLAFAACIALLCASCSQPFDIAVSGASTNIRLAFTEPGWFGRSAVTPCIRTLTVFEGKWPTNEAGDHEVWQIRARNGCVPLAGVDVGHVPDGFVKTIDRLPLEPGSLYHAATDAGPLRGSTAPWWVCDGASLAARATGERIDDPAPDCAPGQEPWRPRNARLMDAIERQVKMPPGERPLKDYARFYARQYAERVIGLYMLPPDPRSPPRFKCVKWEAGEAKDIACDFEARGLKVVAGQRTWLENAEGLPFYLIEGGGCHFVTMNYDPHKRIVERVYCNYTSPDGETPDDR
jgi:hypothetical protein